MKEYVNPVGIQLMSERGHPLAISCNHDYFLNLQRPYLTVELYSKWYGLDVIQPGKGLGVARVQRIPFPEVFDLPEGETSFVDHVPNPRAVVRYARKMNYDVDELALELMVGRWELEVGQRYNNIWEE